MCGQVRAMGHLQLRFESSHEVIAHIVFFKVFWHIKICTCEYADDGTLAQVHNNTNADPPRPFFDASRHESTIASGYS